MTTRQLIINALDAYEPVAPSAVDLQAQIELATNQRIERNVITRELSRMVADQVVITHRRQRGGRSILHYRRSTNAPT